MTMGHVVDGRGGPRSATGSGHHGGSGRDARRSRSRGGRRGCRGTGIRGVGPAAAVDVTTLVADPSATRRRRGSSSSRAAATVRVPGGRAVEGYTLNGTSPGPTIRARQGDLVEVTLVNESVADGATLHWHGVDVPNAADGVAGVTQDAVPVGGRLRLPVRRRRTPAPTGTTRTRCRTSRSSGGCSARVVVAPSGPPAESAGTVDEVALLHVYAGQHTLNGAAPDARVTAAPGTLARIRVDQHRPGHRRGVVVDALPVVATDGQEVSGPTEVVGHRVLVPAGGRVDVTLACPDSGAARLHVGGARSVVVGPAGASAPDVPQPRRDARPPHATARHPRWASTPRGRTGSFDYVIGRRIGLVDGRPGTFWTVNGHLFPDVPMFHVDRGRRRAVPGRQRLRRGAPDAPARPPRRRPVARRRGGARQPVGRRLPRRAAGRELRGRLRRRQPRHLERPLPHARARRRRAHRPPHVRGRHHPLHHRRPAANHPE